MTSASGFVSDRRRESARWLRDLLRSAILRDAARDSGGVLPSEGDLMLRHAAPRAVVRQALDLLRHEGIVERVQGTGTLVIAQRYVHRLVEMHGVTDAEPAAFSSHVLAWVPMPMPPPVAHHLEQAVGSPCVMIEYVGMVRGEVVGLYTNYLDGWAAERLDGVPFNGHWYALLADAGLPIGETDLVIEAMLADELLATTLGIPVGRPVLGMQQVIRDDTGRPYDFAVLRHRGDRISVLSHGASPVAGSPRWDAR
jgi:GntR family transcriptional regulator